MAIISRGAILTRLENAQCALQISVGRIPGTAMPPEWAASGAKLGFLLEVEFCKENCADFDMNKERLLGSGKPSFRAVEPLNEPTFVGRNGQEIVQVTHGAYGCEVQQLEAQQYMFRFFLDFPEGAVRNDVELPAERIFFLSSCWIEDLSSMEWAKQRQQMAEKALQEVNDELVELKRESSTSNFVQKALSLRQSVKLLERRTALENQLQELEQTYPLRSDALIRGPNGIIFAKEGIIAVKRYRGAMGTREQYHWVGTFSFKEFFEDDDEEEED
jgi:hypothetical protein